MTPLDLMALWQRTLASQGDRLDAPREVLRQALWRVADQIAGPDYPINPAEASCSAAPFCCTMRRM